MEKQWDYNDKTLILVKFETDNVSFSTEFGVQNQTRIVAKEITVFIFNLGIEVDITKHLKEFEPKLYGGLLRACEEHFSDTIGDINHSLEAKYSEYEDIEDY